MIQPPSRRCLAVSEPDDAAFAARPRDRHPSLRCRTSGCQAVKRLGTLSKQYGGSCAGLMGLVRPCSGAALMHHGFGAVGLEAMLPCSLAYTIGTNLWGSAVLSRLELHTGHARGVSCLSIQKQRSQRPQ